MGENPSQTWAQTRMDSLYDMRQIYSEARSVKVEQDEWCDLAAKGTYEGLGKYPESSLVRSIALAEIGSVKLMILLLQRLEALVDTLRGKVLVNVHCVSDRTAFFVSSFLTDHISTQYEATDFDALARLSNEFK